MSEQRSDTTSFDVQREIKMRMAQTYQFLLPYALQFFQLAQVQFYQMLAYLSSILIAKEKSVKGDVVLITGSAGCLGNLISNSSEISFVFL